MGSVLIRQLCGQASQVQGQIVLPLGAASETGVVFEIGKGTQRIDQDFESGAAYLEAEIEVGNVVMDIRFVEAANALISLRGREQETTSYAKRGRLE